MAATGAAVGFAGGRRIARRTNRGGVPTARLLGCALPGLSVAAAFAANGICRLSLADAVLGPLILPPLIAVFHWRSSLALVLLSGALASLSLPRRNGPPEQAANKS